MIKYGHDVAMNFANKANPAPTQTESPSQNPGANIPVIGDMMPK
jgi:hypothetical protein